MRHFLTQLEIQLFFFDTGTATARDQSSFSGTDSSTSIGQELQSGSDHFVVWEDSDDERLRISLAGNDRLRKLRLTEAEDVISGKDYIRRLRKQFERLQPAPEWATVTGGRSAKRRKTNRSAAIGDGSEDVDTTSDEEEHEYDEGDRLSSKPLALLLQNATELTKDENSGTSRGKRNLRPEVLDIERLKDVGGNQPVCLRPPTSPWYIFAHKRLTLLFQISVVNRFAMFPSQLSLAPFFGACVNIVPPPRVRSISNA